MRTQKTAKQKAISLNHIQKSFHKSNEGSLWRFFQSLSLSLSSHRLVSGVGYSAALRWRSVSIFSRRTRCCSGL